LSVSYLFNKYKDIDMKYITKFIVVISIFFSFNAYANPGPTSIGDISIGMSKAEFVKAIGINPVDCNTYKGKDGKSPRSELKHLSPERKSLCWNYDFDEKGSTENIQVSGISYDVVEANYEASKVIEKIGHSSKAIFFVTIQHFVL